MTPRILIVEDDPDIAQLVVRYLDKGGFTTELTASGRDAIAAISQRPPDLLVLDLMLPHVDGLEVCRVVRANKATASLPIIMLTARAEESERILGLEVGADDYLAKPFSPNELVARVRALLRRAQRLPAPRENTFAYGPIALDTERAYCHIGREPCHTDMSRDVLLTDVWGYQHVTCHGIDLVIGFVSPASTPSQEGIRRGIEILAGWGLRVETGTHAFDTRDHYLAGRDEDRLADINDALRDPGIRAIPATTGGKGAYRMIVRPIPLRSTRSSAS